ncbi:hypothetical protein JTB14_020932 [Gonioctena quinquepunctata]|nr:hypothetical protein JTB14_020932 [Gonioctena quinquepunctata]
MNLIEKWIYVQKFPKRISDTRLRYQLVRSYTSRSEIQVRNDVKPLPKACPRNTTRESRKGNSRIYTSTPERGRIEELEKAKLMNVKKTNTSRKLVSESKPEKMQSSKQSKRRKKNKAVSDDISSSDSDINSPFIAKKKIKNDLSDSDMDLDYSADDDELNELLDGEKILRDDYLLVKFATKKRSLHYVGKVINVMENGTFETYKFINMRRCFTICGQNSLRLLCKMQILSNLGSQCGIKVDLSHSIDQLRFVVHKESHKMYKLAVFSALLVAVYGLPQVRVPQEIRILAQDQIVNPDGSYQWNYETENGIQAQEQAVQKPTADGNLGTAAQGLFRYTSPNGEPIEVRYTADENGFRAEGNAIPQSPPIPPQILRALEWNAAHPETERPPQVQYTRGY